MVMSHPCPAKVAGGSSKGRFSGRIMGSDLDLPLLDTSNDGYVILAIDARLCLFHPRADEARVRPSSEQGLASAVWRGPLITSSPRHPG